MLIGPRACRSLLPPPLLSAPRSTRGRPRDSEHGMPSCLPPRYRLLDLLFAVGGTFAFLGDLGADVWSALRYYQAGNTLWAALHLGLYLLSSAVLQLLSWGWFRADRAGWQGHNEDVPVSEMRSNGARYQEEDGTVPTESAPSAGGCCVDAVPAGDWAKQFPEDMATPSGGNSPCCPHAGTAAVTRNGETNPVLPGSCNLAPGDPDTEKWVCCQPDAEYEPFMGHFHTSRVILWPSCLLIPHFLQLGYLLRCIHSLEVGIAAYRHPESSQYQNYAYFLTHDISMMRLVETFLENTPQLILVLYIIIQQEMIHTFQYLTVSGSH